MTKITFKRSVRDCPANTRERAQAAALGTKPKLVIDWLVLVDGKPRAVFQPMGSRRGWQLRDLAGDDIKWWMLKGMKYRTLEKGDFVDIITKAMSIISTAEDAERKRKRRADERTSREYTERLQAEAWQRKQRIAAAAPKLLEACQEALLHLEAPEDSARHWAISRGNLAKMLTTAIGEATGDQPNE